MTKKFLIKKYIFLSFLKKYIKLLLYYKLKMNTRLNIAFIGDRNVGKSRLIHNLVNPIIYIYLLQPL
jgi:GTP-binding protein EngB required for normal cell division